MINSMAKGKWQKTKGKSTETSPRRKSGSSPSNALDTGLRRYDGNFCPLPFDFCPLPCRNDGQAITEMVIVIPLLIMLLSGAMAWVYTCWQGVKVQQAANIAARIQG